MNSEDYKKAAIRFQQCGFCNRWFEDGVAFRVHRRHNRCLGTDDLVNLGMRAEQATETVVVWRGVKNGD